MRDKNPHGSGALVGDLVEHPRWDEQGIVLKNEPIDGFDSYATIPKYCKKTLLVYFPGMKQAMWCLSGSLNIISFVEES